VLTWWVLNCTDRSFPRYQVLAPGSATLRVALGAIDCGRNTALLQRIWSRNAVLVVAVDPTTPHYCR
jgi:hypothetical protein